MSCNHTLDVSLLIDGELSPVEAPATVDHLLACAECHQFFRRGRALDAALLLAAAEESGDAEPAPPAVWQRIGAEVGRELRRETAAPAARSARKLPRWAQALAAGLLLVVGATAGWRLAGTAVSDARGAALDADPVRGAFVAAADSAEPPAAGATMDEERFVAIARELLAADRRYRDAMAGVLVVANSAEPREGSTAESSWREEDLRSLRPDGARLY